MKRRRHPRRGLTSTITRAAGAAAVTAPLWWAGSAAALPTLTAIPEGAGSHGYPYDAVPTTPAFEFAPSINLAADGYTEQEYQMSGSATTYNQNGIWGSNGEWSATAGAKEPYTTRILVRYPTDPAKFNGTVVFEWLNDTTGSDQDPMWAELYPEILSQGYAYVEVTAQTSGINDLKTWDPQRYGALGDSSDAESYDIFTQAAQAVKADYGTILGGDVPQNLIGGGDSQSAFRIDTYVNAIQPLTHAFNGFLAVGRSAVAAPIGSGLVSLFPFPALIRTNNTTPFIQLNTAGDIVALDAAAARQPDNNDLRTWELPAASHIDFNEAQYEVPQIYRAEPQDTIPSCALGTPLSLPGTPINGLNGVDPMPLDEVERAALASMQTWMTKGNAPAHSPQISTTSQFGGLYDTVNNDKYGNSLGGIRLPDISVPTQTYGVVNYSNLSQEQLSPPELLSTLENIFTTLESGGITNNTLRTEGLCILSGYSTPFSGSDARIAVRLDGELRLAVHDRGECRRQRGLPDADRRGRRDLRREPRDDSVS